MLNVIKQAIPSIFAVGIFLPSLILAGYNFATLETTMQYLSWGFLSAYLLWILVEMRVSLGEIGKGGQEDDRWSCEFYALSRGLTILLAVGTPSIFSDLNFYHIIGFLVFIIAVGFRLRAIATLGEFYSHRVRLQEEHKVISWGPYRFVRHPAYTGMLLANIGFVLFFLNIYAVLSLLFLLIPAILWRIHIEEINLYKLDGYSKYAVTRKRILPFIW